jgi:hypothetical protein
VVFALPSNFQLSVISVTALAFRFDLTSRKPIEGVHVRSLLTQLHACIDFWKLRCREKDQAKCDEPF